MIPLYPLLAALLSLCWAPGGLARTGPRPCGYLNLLMVAIAFIHSVVAFISLYLASTGPTPPSLPLHFNWVWLQTAVLLLSFDGIVNEAILIAMTVITGLHLLTQVYAIGYLEMDWGWPRFLVP